MSDQERQLMKTCFGANGPIVITFISWPDETFTVLLQTHIHTTLHSQYNVPSMKGVKALNQSTVCSGLHGVYRAVYLEVSRVLGFVHVDSM